MKQPTAIFSAQVFIEKIDLSRVELTSDTYVPSYLSGIKTTMGSDQFTDASYQYVHGLIDECIGQFADDSFYLGQVWRNKYDKTDWHDPHIHSGAQWSFIIYETVDISRTVFMNPARKVIMNQWGMYASTIPMDFVPNAPQGSIVIFPSWVEHFVMNGNEGTTIAGNVYLSDPPKGPNE